MHDEFLKKQLEILKEKKKNPNIEWQDVTDMRMEYYNMSEHRDVTRKGAKLLYEYLEAGWDLVPPSSISFGDYDDVTKLQKERLKFRSEKNEYNKWLRELSRDELITEHLVHAINDLQPLSIPKCIPIVHLRKDYLLTFADAHYGVEFQIKDLFGSIINEYSPEIFEERMWNLYAKVVEQVKKDNITELHIWDLGDDLDGILRANSQLMQLRYGIIDSGILYAEFLANWLNQLSHTVRIKFQMTKRSNHNQLRLVGQPKNSFPDEDMGKTILFFIKERLKNNPNVTIIENPTGLPFAQLANYAVIGGHFETKNLSSTINDLSRIYNVPLDYIISGHWHSLALKDVGVDSEAICVRSIIGANPFSMSINKISSAGASMSVFEQGEGRVCEYHYKLN